MDGGLRHAKEQYWSWKHAVPALERYGDRRLRGGSSRRGATNANNVDATQLGVVAQDNVNVNGGMEGGVKNLAGEVSVANVNRRRELLDGMG